MKLFYTYGCHCLRVCSHVLFCNFVIIISSVYRCSLSWSTYYLAEKYPVEFEPPTPLVRDPTNPGFNVAETLPYWGQFRSEYIQWMRGLGMAVCSNGST